MNIAFLFGNGFDIKLGLKTKYLHFLNYYLKLESDSPLIRASKEHIREDMDSDHLWSELELKLGEFTKRFSSYEEYHQVFLDIHKELGNYILQEENKFYDYLDKKINDNKTKYIDVLISDLSNFENYLPRADKELLNNFKYGKGEDINIDIITFNYTRVLDKLFDFEFKMLIGKSINQRQIYLNNILHVHGYSDNRLILGVNDTSQIKNESFRDQKRIVNALVKPECNRVQKQLVERDCATAINNSNLICLFGLSIGKTDAYWWNIIGKKLSSSDTRLLVFYYLENDSIPPSQRFLLDDEEDVVFDQIILNSGLNDLPREKVIICFSNDIFNFMMFEIAEVSIDKMINNKFKINRQPQVTVRKT